ncbi:hypothetical protein CH63R_02948 [Colletotrichum higginsianum IMI 349063]|uniref:Uncharacterized protein n=1 Tax=Colletotrichum higginsianum (strain IMI 349063) TaxID=759273 RepID=A0A1B7YQI9_COLHI|nr:hypothetical protein CH63R_02948 [Colletotrichum higginsianum IMI 349063]OBR14222.1 hypothetical protein CH63R_02948 [Colletotrichum higginsianum IMI 349063]
MAAYFPSAALHWTVHGPGGLRGGGLDDLMVGADEEESSLSGCESPPSGTLLKGDTPASASEHEMDVDITETDTLLEQDKLMAADRISPRRPRYLDSDAHYIGNDDVQNEWAAQRLPRTLQSPQPERSLRIPPYARVTGSPRSGPSRTHTLFHSNYPPMSRYQQYSRCPSKQQRYCRFTPNRTHPSSVYVPGVDMGPIPGITLTNDAGSPTVWTSRVGAPNRPDGAKVDALPCRASPFQKRHEHPAEEESIGKKLKTAQGDEDEYGMGCD